MAKFEVFLDLVEKQNSTVFNRLVPEFHYPVRNADDVFRRQAVSIIRQKRVTVADGGYNRSVSVNKAKIIGLDG